MHAVLGGEVFEHVAAYQLQTLRNQVPAKSVQAFALAKRRLSRVVDCVKSSSKWWGTMLFNKIRVVSNRSRDLSEVVTSAVQVASTTYTVR